MVIDAARSIALPDVQFADCQFVHIQEHRLCTSGVHFHVYPLLGRFRAKSRKRKPFTSGKCIPKLKLSPALAQGQEVRDTPLKEHKKPSRRLRGSPRTALRPRLPFAFARSHNKTRVVYPLCSQFTNRRSPSQAPFEKS